MIGAALLGPVMLIIFLWILYEVFLNAARRANDTHNKNEKNNPRFVPGTERDAKATSTGCISVIVMIILVLIIMSMGKH